MPATFPDFAVDAPAPQHGDRGERAARADTELRGLTVAISREVGARGGALAKRVARDLGWQLFDQDLMGYLAENEAARDELMSEVPAGVRQWAAEQYDRVRSRGGPAAAPELAEWFRLMFAIGARGDVVILGRGAGALLPAASTLNVRVVAPAADRVAYMAQRLRLPASSAQEEVAARERVRADLHRAVSGRDPGDLGQYDLVLNSARLGEAACAGLIREALRDKQLPGDSSGSSVDELAVV